MSICFDGVQRTCFLSNWNDNVFVVFVLLFLLFSHFCQCFIYRTIIPVCCYYSIVCSDLLIHGPQSRRMASSNCDGTNLINGNHFVTKTQNAHWQKKPVQFVSSVVTSFAILLRNIRCFFHKTDAFHVLLVWFVCVFVSASFRLPVIRKMHFYFASVTISWFVEFGRLPPSTFCCLLLWWLQLKIDIRSAKLQTLLFSRLIFSLSLCLLPFKARIISSHLKKLQKISIVC